MTVESEIVQLAAVCRERLAPRSGRPAQPALRRFAGMYVMRSTLRCSIAFGLIRRPIERTCRCTTLVSQVQILSPEPLTSLGVHQPCPSGVIKTPRCRIQSTSSIYRPWRRSKQNIHELTSERLAPSNRVFPLHSHHAITQ